MAFFFLDFWDFAICGIYYFWGSIGKVLLCVKGLGNLQFLGFEIWHFLDFWDFAIYGIYYFWEGAFVCKGVRGGASWVIDCV